MLLDKMHNRKGGGTFSKQVRHTASTFGGAKKNWGRKCPGTQPRTTKSRAGVACWRGSPLPPKSVRGCHPLNLLKILDTKACIFVHTESRNALQLLKNFNMTGKIQWKVHSIYESESGFGFGETCPVVSQVYVYNVLRCLLLKCYLICQVTICLTGFTVVNLNPCLTIKYPY